ncbi:RsiV family protein [Castellaniella caeni]|uniref:RsiV family protein n=1 Tax=Castellaniella caeni TaxID=266123 RepID=UPI0008363634|nr:RsiV family protein [Castellaniella caeni]
MPHRLTVRALPLVLASTLLLGACASGPKDTLSLIPEQLDQQTSQQGLFAQPVQWTRTRPGCSGTCPKIVMHSLAFPGHPRLTTLVEHALVSMTWLDTKSPAPYDTLPEYESYFWKTAGARDETDLIAKTRYRNQRLTVVELTVGQYQTGMAHGMSGTQFLNWDNRAEKALTIDNLLAPGARPAFDAALREAHTQWLQSNPAVRDDPNDFSRMWPFVSSDNVALTDQGIVVKYQPYEIAPYAWGQPELLIPYPRLRGVLRPQFLPAD